MFAISRLFGARKSSTVAPDDTVVTPKVPQVENPRSLQTPKTPPWLFMTRTSRKQCLNPPSIFDVPSRFKPSVTFPSPLVAQSELRSLEDFDTFYSDYGDKISFNDMLDMLEICNNASDRKMSKSQATARPRLPSVAEEDEDEVPSTSRWRRLSLAARINPAVYYPRAHSLDKGDGKLRRKKHKKRKSSNLKQKKKVHKRVKRKSRDSEWSSMPELSSSSDDGGPKSPITPIIKAATNFFQF